MDGFAKTANELARSIFLSSSLYAPPSFCLLRLISQNEERKSLSPPASYAPPRTARPPNLNLKPKSKKRVPGPLGANFEEREKKEFMIIF